MKYFQTKITIPNELREMAKIRKIVEERCDRFGYPPDLTYMMVTAVDETCANVIKYAYKKSSGTRYVMKDRNRNLVELLLRVDPGKFELEVLDKGFKFNPVERSTSTIDFAEGAKKKGGMGLPFLKNILDTMDYQFSEDRKNVLKLVKYFSK